MTLDRIPDDKGEKHGSVIDMTWHRKKREVQKAREAKGKVASGKGAGSPWKLRAAMVLQGAALVFGVLVLFRGCGRF